MTVEEETPSSEAKDLNMNSGKDRILVLFEKCLFVRLEPQKKLVKSSPQTSAKFGGTFWKTRATTTTPTPTSKVS